MLGYVVPQGRGASDVLIREVAARLRDGGVRLAGAVQINVETGPDTKCMMDLHVLSGFDVVRISQNLGALSRGCRLDPDGLERAVGLVSASLRDGAALLIVNKFGKQEADGRGFRPVIGEALAAGIPVLTAVGPSNVEAFLSFAEGLAEELPEDASAIETWCRAQIAEHAS
ncbi:MAG: DUF2478 domain-containing protein [Rhodobacteraceae bacterium]|jgi:hypothetical protein|uniref:3-dehydroquinate dehydratase n=1 Tax=Salipiger profundus TaxID=1229727 RepID=A0A1U7D4D0_9RHOB|nr:MULTISPECIES: DUF2478 domain-containing protein [Salipiger]APX22925.1 Protein of unknown function (DUF2478) [Salipiger profundus]MAB04592.1 DUF2478 domain-containing protein [Paracoccaceae bacterium]GGA12085.1 hypothetical protein GCM10011326_24920 [Salipiger profundus]SFD23626.1 Protein of unknown function [Salipiger profundus]